jgi:AraC-like DNA-binding protein
LCQRGLQDYRTAHFSTYSQPLQDFNVATRYLAFARLVRAARLFENPGLSVASVANALEYSSPQSFGRHVRTMLRLTAVQFRDRYDGEGMLHRFRAELVTPFLPALRRFTPLTVPPGWLGEEGRRRMVQ